jgi:hypothetical protein
MSSSPPSAKSRALSGSSADRYVSFRGIDFEGNMQAVLGHLRCYSDDPAKGNAFWDRFKVRLAEAEMGAASIADNLLLMHSYTYYMVDLFEEHARPRLPTATLPKARRAE